MDSHSGPVIKNVEVHPIYYGKGIVSYSSQLDKFYSAVTQSPWMDVMAQYGVGRGSAQPGSHFMPNATTTAATESPKMTDEQIQALLLEMIKEGDIVVTENTYFPVHFSKGTVIQASDGSLSCDDWCGYHSSLVLPTPSNGIKNLYYGVIPDFGEGSHCKHGCGSKGGSELGNLESTASHELAEACTDPVPGSDFQLRQYLQRINLFPAMCTSPATIEALDTIIQHHSKTIPFENTELLLLNKPGSIQLDSIFEQLVLNQRGGYCFQNNILIASALSAMGYTVVPGIANLAYWDTATELFKFKSQALHMVLWVVIRDIKFLVDLGGFRFSCALEMRDRSRVKSAAGEEYELRRMDEERWGLYHRRAEWVAPRLSSCDGFSPVFCFAEKRVTYKEYEDLNLRVATDPTHKLKNQLIVSKVTETFGNAVMTDSIYRRREIPECVGLDVKIQLGGVVGMGQVLRDEFGIIMSNEEAVAMEYITDPIRIQVSVMGRLKLFNRRVPLATDDAYVPAAYGLLLHSIWLASTAVVYAVIRNDCNISPVLINFLLILISTLSIQVPLDLLILFLSMSGTVARKGPRRYVSAVVQVSFFAAHYLQPVETPECKYDMDSSSPVLIHMVVIWSFLAIIFYFLTVGVLLANSERKTGLVDSDVLRDVAGELAFYFKEIQARRLLIEQPVGFEIPTLDDQKVRNELAKVQGEEESRRMTFMNSGKSVRKYIQDLDASAAASSGGAPSVLVQAASPIIEEEEEEGGGSNEPKRILPSQGLGLYSAEPEVLTDLETNVVKPGADHDIPMGPIRNHHESWKRWPQPPTSIQTFSIPIGFPPSPRNQTRKIKHGTVLREEIDDILYFARFAEVVYTPENVDMIYSDKLHFHSTDNGIYRCPYLIVHDEVTDSIVIAIRGTYSAADVLVDLKFDVTPLIIPELDDGEDHLAHGGFMTTAKNILADLKRLNILEPLLNDKGSEYYGCSLVVTGHSLGAGVAALLANMLRYDFPSTCCYTFEPPGCVVSRRAAEHFEHFCTSVVMGDDVVTRLSRNTMEMLKLDIDRHLKSCDEPKWKVFGSVLGDRLCCGRNGPNSTSARKRGARTSRPGILQRRTPSGHLFPEDLAKLKRRTNSLRAGKKGEDNYFAGKELPTPPMYIPGKILHIEKLRRPPLNMNQIMGRQLKKVVGATKAVGTGLKVGAEGLVDLVFEGAEKITHGVEDIGDLILDGADFVRDGAEGIKDKIVPQKHGHQQGSRSNVAGRSSGLAATPGAQEEPVLVPLNDAEDVSYVKPSPAKKRGTSLADLFDVKGSRSKGSEDARLSLAAVPTAKSDDQPLSGESDDLAEQAANAMEKQKVSFVRGVSMAEGTSSRGDRGERQSRRRRRKLERARSAGNIRSKSAGRDGFVSNAEETEVSTDDEDGAGAHRTSRFRSRRSRTKKESGAVTDTEVFSDSELADLGGTRFKGKTTGKQTLAGILGGADNTRRQSEQGAQRSSKFPKINTNLGAPKSSDGLNQRLSASPTRMRDPNPSIKPRAHVDAVPSDSITGKVVPVGSAILDVAIAPCSPTSPNGVISIEVVQPSPIHITHQSLTYQPSVMEAAKVSSATAAELRKIEEEEDDADADNDDDDDVGGPSSPAVRFQDRNPSVISIDDFALSKPQYPPTPLNAKDAAKGALPQGPKVHGKYHYVPRWARKEEFQEIIVSRSMIVDHSPFELLREFQAAPAGSVLGVVTRN
ncbi:UNVERIFIED_CONTAM: hypothetical protein HDU68_000234 [Siphonaria sp. JEL0065]|nr:hypothetical protein HDU68_000234 [Siphonaria sp. JEL0065]